MGQVTRFGRNLIQGKIMSNFSIKWWKKGFFWKWLACKNQNIQTKIELYCAVVIWFRRGFKIRFPVQNLIQLKNIPNFPINWWKKGLFGNFKPARIKISKKKNKNVPWWFDLDGVTSPSSCRISKLGLLEIWSKGTAWDFFPIRFWVHLPGSFSFSRFLSLVNGKPEVDFFFSPRPRVCKKMVCVDSKTIVYICRYSPQNFCQNSKILNRRINS